MSEQVATGSDSRDVMPSVLLVSIPKSGTVYMNKMFSLGLGLQNTVVSNRYFPEDQLYFDVVPSFANGGCIASVHIDASGPNLQLLDAYVPKWVVHFRDPRAVLLSWVHHVRSLAEGEHWHTLLAVYPTPPRELFTWTFEKQVDWHIEHFSPSITRWMDGWLDICLSRPNRILVTEFAELRKDEGALSRRILSFFGIDHSHYTHTPPERTLSSSHFRVGSLDEWRSVLSADQRRRATALIPDRLFSAFGWSE